MEMKEMIHNAYVVGRGRRSGVYVSLQYSDAVAKLVDCVVRAEVFVPLIGRWVVVLGRLTRCPYRNCARVYLRPYGIAQRVLMLAYTRYRNEMRSLLCPPDKQNCYFKLPMQVLVKLLEPVQCP
jgi:hypothetical protein